MSQTETTLTKKQIFLSRIALGAAVMLLGIFLLLCGADLIKVRVLKVLLPATLFAAMLVCFAWAFIQDNTLMLWLTMPLAFSALVTVLVLVSAHGYGAFYPLYIVSPAAGSLIVAVYEGRWRDHLKFMVFFAGGSAIFLFNSAFGVSLAVVIPIFVLFAGVAITAYSAIGRSE